MSDYFITGTDTGVGKTWATLALMRALQDKGKAVVGMKPVASGCQKTSAGLRNNDAVRIIKQSSSLDGQTLNYETVNPYAFEQAIAPHIAAEKVSEQISIKKIDCAFNLLKRGADHVIVEGVGGWRVPLGRNTMLVDMVKCLDLPVILVIGLRLGCINHALLSAEAIKADGLDLVGCVVNRTSNKDIGGSEIISTITDVISAPLLADIPFLEHQDVGVISRLIKIDSLV